MKAKFQFICLLAILVACSSPERSQTTISQADIDAETLKANEFFERTYQDGVERSPVTMAYLGLKKDQDKWNDLSDERAAEDLEITKSELKWLTDSIDYELLDDQTKISYDLFKSNAENAITDYKYRYHSYPVNQMFGLHSQVPSLLINIHQVSNTQDAENYVGRLNGVKPLFDQLITNLKTREEKGILPPKFVYARVIDDCMNLLKGAPFDNGKSSTLMSNLETKIQALEISNEEKNELLEDGKKALLTSVKSGYENLIEFLKGQESRATEDDGAWKFPDGENFFNNALNRTTTTKLTADEIHEIGLREVARIHGEMREIMKQVGFKGNLQDFFPVFTRRWTVLL